MKIAVVGSGISGLSAAYYLSKKHHVDLFEKDDHFGGHAHTLKILYEDKKEVAVDIGFMVFNKKTYPNLINFFLENKIEIMESTQTLFTLLAMIQHRGADAMDTKWFAFEHEGQKGGARFLLADSQNVWIGKDSIMCDHYRLDLNLSDNSGKFLEKSDYFMEEIIVDNLVREIWVSKRKPKKIIRASLKHSYWFPVMAQINE